VFPRVGTRASFDAEQKNRHQTHRRSYSARMPNIRRARASALSTHPDSRSRGECSAMCGGSIKNTNEPIYCAAAMERVKNSRTCAAAARSHRFSNVASNWAQLSASNRNKTPRLLLVYIKTLCEHRDQGS
jgi:hypothetical protein